MGLWRSDAPEEGSARPPRAEARHAFLRGRFAGDEAEAPDRRGACGDGCRHARARSRGGAGEPGGIARHFAQGKAIEKRVGLAVVALARLGHLSAAARRFRRAAGRRLSGFRAPTMY